MRNFGYAKPADLDAALVALSEPGTAAIAGGTELVNWLKEGIATPERVVDITGLAWDGIDVTGSLRVGALARMSEVAAHPAVRRDYPVLVESLLAAASAQLRNMATIGGNLLQRTRCPYFRAETLLPCNQRRPGSGCAAIEGGDTHASAIFGWTRDCVATHPSDLAVALAALDATVLLHGPGGERTVPLRQFYRPPRADGGPLTVLAPDELIVAVTMPGTARCSHYLKVRERVSYEFAVVSVAVVVELEGLTITTARLALGGVAYRPWRLLEAESALCGTSIGDAAALRDAIAGSFEQARPLPDNAFKVELARRAAVRALQSAGGV